MTTKIPGLRAGTAEDAVAICNVINRAFAVESFFKKGDRTDVQQVREKIRSGEFFVVERGVAVVACVYLETANAANPKVLADGEGAGYIGMLAVDPTEQGKGLGKELMRFGEEELQRRGCTRIQIRIIKLRTELAGYYRSMGFVETGTAPYPYTEKLSQAVHFINMEKRVGS